MKRLIARYLLYIYINFIKEDLSDLKEWIIPFMKITHFIRSIYIWTASIIFLPVFLIGMYFDENKEKIMNIYFNKNYKI